MKAVLVILFGFLISISANAQGWVIFANSTSPDTRALTNNSLTGQSGFTDGVNQYLFGLYTAPAGTIDESQFVLRLTATNRAGPVVRGLFNNSPTGGIAGLTIGVPIGFQVRAWSFRDGGPFDTYENRNDIDGVSYNGKSAIGTVTPGDPSGNNPGILFGTGPEQISQGIVLVTPVPEPSSTVLLLIGGAIGLFAIRSPTRCR